MTTTIVNYGSINIDHVYRVPHFVQPGETLAATSLETGLGGKGANQSVAIARAGGKVCHVGRLSKADAWALTLLNESGVDTHAIGLEDGASGHAIIQVDDNGENSILLHGGANQNCQAQELAAVLEARPDIGFMLAQNECSDLAQAIDLCLAKGIKVALNPAPMSESIKSLPLNKLDTLIVNEVEAQALCGNDKDADIIAYCHDELANTRVVLTLGKCGAILIDGGNSSIVETPQVQAVDTTAAGDTFVGYFLHGLASGQDQLHALNYACAAAALTVTKVGAISAIPTAAEVEQFLNA